MAGWLTPLICPFPLALCFPRLPTVARHSYLAPWDWVVTDDGAEKAHKGPRTNYFVSRTALSSMVGTSRVEILSTCNLASHD